MNNDILDNTGLYYPLYIQLSIYNLVGGLEHFSCFHILGTSSSQLTFIFFRGVAQPPTSNILYYPYTIYYLLYYYTIINHIYIYIYIYIYIQLSIYNILYILLTNSIVN